MNSRPPSDTRAIILAAGVSSRMGEPKQLLKLGNQTLLNRCIETVSKVPFASMTVVLGAYAQEIIPTLPEDPGVDIFVNPNHRKGLGNSIASSVRHVMESDTPEAVVLILADQPYLKAEHLQTILNRHEPNADEILVSNYQNDLSGPPVLLTARFFPELCKLDGDNGAKAVISRHPEYCTKIDLSDFSPVDIDTAEDYQKLVRDFEV